MIVQTRKYVADAGECCARLALLLLLEMLQYAYFALPTTHYLQNNVEC